MNTIKERQLAYLSALKESNIIQQAFLSLPPAKLLYLTLYLNPKKLKLRPYIYQRIFLILVSVVQMAKLCFM